MYYFWDEDSFLAGIKKFQWFILAPHPYYRVVLASMAFILT
jgi:hypothetical protein